jgi:RNA polymerase sigma-70 factor (ECF subfamily)
MSVPMREPKQNSNSAELTELFRTHFDFVWRVLRRYGLSEAEAEDGVQEIFLVLASEFDRVYEERGALRAWLFAIARNLANHVRRANSRRERRHEQCDSPLPAADPHALAERRQTLALVERFLASLDEDQALVFFLSEIEEMSAPEIASALGVALSTVYGRQRLARKRFEAFMKRHAKEWVQP